jgi:hypothetical protein
MAAGDVADGEGHGEDRESEGEGHADVADAEMDARGEDGASATAKDKPEGAEGTRLLHVSREASCHLHFLLV